MPARYMTDLAQRSEWHPVLGLKIPPGYLIYHRRPSNRAKIKPCSKCRQRSEELSQIALTSGVTASLANLPLQIFPIYGLQRQGLCKISHRTPTTPQRALGQAARWGHYQITVAGPVSERVSMIRRRTTCSPSAARSDRVPPPSTESASNDCRSNTSPSTVN